jgi:ribosomal protein S12 methylthiotransferase
MKNAPKIHLVNLGCSKNQVDSESILGELISRGAGQTSSPEDCDVIVINTCGFIESAKEESIDEILSFGKTKKPNQKLVVAGCLSQRYKEQLTQDMPEVDHFVGTYHPGEIAALLKLPENELCQTGSTVRQLLEPGAHHAYLKVSEGCNRVCSFCAIPGIRGKQRSRKTSDIITEANQLVQSGIKELVLVAQDLTFFGREKNGPQSTLESLLQNLLQETDVPWIRLMYAYPAFLPDSLLELIAGNSRICSYLDMPTQHSSDQILQWMRRGHTRKSLDAILRRIRKGFPEIALRTTVLTGFPGETQDDVQDLLEFMEEYRFERLGAFTYSPEDGTYAETLDLPKVDPDEAMARAEQIMTLQQEISLERNQSLVGQTVKVLVDEVCTGEDYRYRARTQWDAPEIDNSVLITDGELEPGSFHNVQILDAAEFDLFARTAKESTNNQM